MYERILYINIMWGMHIYVSIIADTRFSTTGRDQHLEWTPDGRATADNRDFYGAKYTSMHESCRIDSKIDVITSLV